LARKLKKFRNTYRNTKTKGIDRTTSYTILSANQESDGTLKQREHIEQLVMQKISAYRILLHTYIVFLYYRINAYKRVQHYFYRNDFLKTSKHVFYRKLHIMYDL
jgi:hypothetical protein